MFKGMTGATLGVWVAHGEGRVHFPDPDVQKNVMDNNLAPLRYVDDASEPTEAYVILLHGVVCTV
jgi:phosphoribosylformylglycinamidine synthase